ncbi:MaoC family dehydratase [Spongiibacter sp. KMU-166]|uniref:MaoC family dehydratase n=1 Tax=Spongiibacter thalassae TaxID=2721624 RepID=A0ABX1GLH5_9GAMM|nr:MaoC family dehydratase [Spongiibacter thalassae]NKI19328.1 MaoC family dehydratase [Spongiibacter thalassae]
MKIISRDEIQNYLGQELEPTEWFEVSQERVNQFADVTLDHQFIHTDEEKAKQTPFGGTIAHGFLTLSMLSHFSGQYGLVIDGTQMGINYGFEKVRFLAPVRVGKRIRARAKVLSIEETKPNQFRLSTEVTVDIEGEDKPALIAEWLAVQVVG